MKVKLIDHMGSDLTVVNAARVSFSKYHHEFDHNGDRSLIRYLAKHGHWTPFGHPQITLHVKVPIFVARQLHKHQVGFVVNEVSRRYVDEEPEFYRPKVWRARAENKKQGSSEEVIKFPRLGFEIVDYEDAAYSVYLNLLEDGVAPEQARMVLPLSTYTEFYMTGSLAAWARLYNLRIQPDAQKEIQEVAGQIGEIIQPLFPVSWEALCQEHT